MLHAKITVDLHQQWYRDDQIAEDGWSTEASTPAIGFAQDIVDCKYPNDTIALYSSGAIRRFGVTVVTV